MPVRSGPPETAGRWSLLPATDDGATVRAHALAERLLDRHGVVTRGAVGAERAPGGFAGVYRTLAAFEDAGRVRRGYFVEGLGAAQFATPGAVDRLRTFSEPQADTGPRTGAGPGADAGQGPDDGLRAVCLAATDPANPYGAALPWPESGAGHRPGRKSGGVVVLVEGELVLYLERGGRTVLTWTEDARQLQVAVAALAQAHARGNAEDLTLEKADGVPLLGSGPTALRDALSAAGFVTTPRGLRLRARR